MNYGQRGRELLLDLKRSDWLPPYNEDCVRAALQEINSHTEELTVLVRAANRTSSSTSSGPAIEDRPSLILHDASIRRNKRCLLAYHAHRIDKLRSLRWETSGTLPPGLKSVLSESEVDYFNEYDKLASRHGLAGPMSMYDWNADQYPPEENLVQVRVVRDGLGRVETEYCGTVELEVGSTHYLPRGDVEHLIRSGALVQLSGEESF
jgi:GINS complex subunit 1